jgi:2Fe-2S ferredoxin
VIVAENWISKTGTASEDENQMLDMNPEKADTSRLSCQVQASSDMDGMVLHLPEFQM